LGDANDGYAASVLAASINEQFEVGSKTAYAAARIQLSSGIWNLSDALLGTSTADRKSGTKSVRLRNAGKITMGFDLPNGAETVTISHAKYGTDATSTWGLWVSRDAGATWVQVGSNVSSSTTTLQTATFTVSIAAPIRFEIRKVSSSARFNLDNFSATEPINNPTPTRDNNLALGNPSSATAASTNLNNYLMEKAQFALSYNNSKGGANWVSWHLSAAWKGTAVRQNLFIEDASLPINFYKVPSTAYTNSGFDRGHQCPSDDRDGSQSDNDATFVMTNMLPQAPNANRATWASLEAYCRTLLWAGNECYIIAGGYGQGGVNANGQRLNTIDGGRVNVPARLWKVIVILPVGSSDLSRIGAGTRVIAVDMPNDTNVGSDWGTYRTSVDAIETQTGYNLLSNLSTALQTTLEARIDAGATQ
jgi:endonuclease G